MPEHFGNLLPKEDRRAQAAKLYVRGWTTRQIGQHLGVSHVTVALDLKELRAEWQESRLSAYDEWIAVELAKLGEIESEAWAAWEKSKLDAETRETGENEKGSFSKEKAQGQYGDPRLLATVMDCIKRRCDLLGLDAPKKVNLSDADVDRFIVEELARLAAIPIAALPVAGGSQEYDPGPAPPHRNGESNGHHANGSPE